MFSIAPPRASWRAMCSTAQRARLSPARAMSFEEYVLELQAQITAEAERLETESSGKVLNFVEDRYDACALVHHEGTRNRYEYVERLLSHPPHSLGSEARWTHAQKLSSMCVPNGLPRPCTWLQVEPRRDHRQRGVRHHICTRGRRRAREGGGKRVRDQGSSLCRTGSRHVCQGAAGHFTRWGGPLLCGGAVTRLSLWPSLHSDAPSGYSCVRSMSLRNEVPRCIHANLGMPQAAARPELDHLRLALALSVVRLLLKLHMT
jgi:hypothetical protein